MFLGYELVQPFEIKDEPVRSIFLVKKKGEINCWGWGEQRSIASFNTNSWIAFAILTFSTGLRWTWGILDWCGIWSNCIWYPFMASRTKRSLVNFSQLARKYFNLPAVILTSMLFSGCLSNNQVWSSGDCRVGWPCPVWFLLIVIEVRFDLEQR